MGAIYEDAGVSGWEHGKAGQHGRGPRPLEAGDIAKHRIQREHREERLAVSEQGRLRGGVELNGADGLKAGCLYAKVKAARP